MTANLGPADRLLRLVTGAVLLGFALACPWAREQGDTVRLLAGLAGAVLVLTAALSVCPLYRVLGLSTCRR